MKPKSLYASKFKLIPDHKGQYVLRAWIKDTAGIYYWDSIMSGTEQECREASKHLARPVIDISY